MEEQKKRRARRKFTEEFKTRAVRFVMKEGQTAAQVARDLDLVESVLHGWVRQAKIDRGMGPPESPAMYAIGCLGPARELREDLIPDFVPFAE